MLGKGKVVAAAVLVCLVSRTAFASPTYSLSFDVTNLSYDVDDLYLYSDLGSSLAVSPSPAEMAPPSEILDGGSYSSGPADELLIGVANFDSANHLVLFANTGFAGTQSNPSLGSGVGQTFNTEFSTNETTLIDDILGGSSSDLDAVAMFAASIISTYGFAPNDSFGIIAFSCGTNIGGGQSNFAVTPLPSSWSVLLLGLVCFGLIVYRRQNGSHSLAPV